MISHREFIRNVWGGRFFLTEAEDEREKKAREIPEGIETRLNYVPNPGRAANTDYGRPESGYLLPRLAESGK